MARIDGLPDESLIKILSFLPTKDAVSTSVLSKRWECLWMWLPKLEYNDSLYPESESERFWLFLHRSLPLHKAPILESLCLTFCDSYFIKPEDINKWIVVVASRFVRELNISYSCDGENPLILPSSLYTSKSLVILKLHGDILLEVPPNVCLPCVKTLQLERVSYMDEESLHRLLSICPVLEDLSVDLSFTYKMKAFTIFVPSLKRLTLFISRYRDVAGFVINTPSLEYFKLVDEIPKRHYYVIEYMPKLVEAYIDVVFPDVKSLIGSITSVKRLTLRQRSFGPKAEYGDGFVFNQLEHLKLGICLWHSSNLLLRLLKDSPNLRILGLLGVVTQNLGPTCWNDLTMVPECVLSSLQIFTWSGYSGSPAERDFAVYILKNGRCLKHVIISLCEEEIPERKMTKELARSSRASATCQLIFY